MPTVPYEVGVVFANSTHPLSIDTYEPNAAMEKKYSRSAMGSHFPDALSIIWIFIPFFIVPYQRSPCIIQALSDPLFHDTISLLTNYTTHL
jgi:hypothetical protein